MVKLDNIKIMAKPVCFLFLAALAVGCASKRPTVPQRQVFNSFEISYHSGWAKGFSMIVDSNKIYLSPQRWDTAYYGILPDTLFNLLDTAYAKICIDRSIRYKDGSCIDCSAVAVKIVANGDTTRVNQSGDMDKLFYPLINELQRFIDSGKHERMRGVVICETRAIVVPPPPLIGSPKQKGH
jgi:hypothetical protein